MHGPTRRRQGAGKRFVAWADDNEVRLRTVTRAWMTGKLTLRYSLHHLIRRPVGTGRYAHPLALRNARFLDCSCYPFLPHPTTLRSADLRCLDGVGCRASLW